MVNTMADRDARRRRSLALVRFAIFTALLAFWSFLEQLRKTYPKCRSIAIPALRLECYDNLPKPTYTGMSISDLGLDRIIARQSTGQSKGGQQTTRLAGNPALLAAR